MYIIYVRMYRVRTVIYWDFNEVPTPRDIITEAYLINRYEVSDGERGIFRFRVTRSEGIV
jgi:hypothetical protein